jgi:hypothetical protein
MILSDRPKIVAQTSIHEPSHGRSAGRAETAATDFNFYFRAIKPRPLPAPPAVREAPEKQLAQFILWAKCKPQKRNSSLCEFNHMHSGKL